MGEPNPSMADLRAMSDEELVQRYDQVAATTVPLAPTFFRDEISRRQTERQTDTIRRLTWVVTGLTVANVGLVAWEVLRNANR